jgi:hypothetical protein
MSLKFKGYNFYFIESKHLTDNYPDQMRIEFDVLTKVLTRDEIERINVFNPNSAHAKKVGGLFRIYSTQNPELLQSEGCDLVLNWELNIQQFKACPEANWKVTVGTCASC